MKSIIKKWWLWLIILLTITGIILIIIIVSSNKNHGVGTAGISKEEFDEIIVGETTNFELDSIIDKNNEWFDDEIYEKCVEKIEESKENDKYTYVYKYYGEKNGYVKGAGAN